MGIPKFYRWISERYPSLSRVVHEHEMPEFDCLYLDMNGIIHTCSHPNDNDPNFRITEDQIFNDVCAYVETLFRIVQPRRLFYMAVDGCAPRAKMNQQRARRFRSAKDAEDARAKAEREGKLKPVDLDNPPFDSNCITPGTPFMFRLQQHLQYFVQAKLDTDPSWRDVEVILSGQEVPGEGEHKIMDYIRAAKLRPDYNANTRHCMYGLDADLIILGLVSHEPRFALLREEVKFGKNQKRESSAEETTFHLLSLSLYREYLDLEFSDIKEHLPFEYEFERLLDDWVLLGFLVGNDFLPHLPYFHIGEDILPMVYDCYKRVIQRLDGWITDGGEIDMNRLEQLLAELANVDFERYQEEHENLKWMASKTGRRVQELDDEPDDLAGFFGEDGSFLPPAVAGQASEQEALMHAEFEEFKNQYYMSKLHLPSVDATVKTQMARTYVTGLQWVLYYYYRGVPSWGWFYPAHYAPFVSDVRGVSGFKPVFELGRPFLPFEQLMAVLPPASRQHVPPAFAELMTAPDSPILDFYPLTFETDLNGKKADWEALVLIPFIDEHRLLSAVATREPLLTSEERSRNRHSLAESYQRDENVRTVVQSPYPNRFPTVTCRVAKRTLPFPHTPAGSAPLQLLAGYDPNQYFPGFPSFFHLNFMYERTQAGVCIFQFPSRGDSLIVQVHTPTPPVGDRDDNYFPVPRNCNDIATKQGFLGANVWVRWPHLVQARAVAISSAREKIVFNGVNYGASTIANNPVAFEDQVQALREDLYKKRGIDIGEVTYLVHVVHSNGFADTYTRDGKILRDQVWSNVEHVYPYQLVLKGINTMTNERDLAEVSLKTRFQAGAQFVFLGQPHYGSRGEVVAVEEGKAMLQVKLRVHVAPASGAIISENAGDRYMSLGQTASMARVPVSLLNRLLGDMIIHSGTEHNPGQKYNIGLRLKFQRRNEQAQGYTCRNDRGMWLLSNQALDLLDRFRQKYPLLIMALLQHIDDRELYAPLLFHGDAAQQLKEVHAFVQNELGAKNRELVPCGTQALSRDTVQRLEILQSRFAVSDKELALPHVHPKLVLLQHTGSRGVGAAPDPQAKFNLGDRVICVRTASAVPWGAEGFVVGIFGGEVDTVEVMFDQPFMGGTRLNDRLSAPRGYRLPMTWLVNISHGLRSAGEFGHRRPSAAEAADQKQAEQQAASTAAAAAAAAASVTPPPPRVPAGAAAGAAAVARAAQLSPAARATTAPAAAVGGQHAQSSGQGLLSLLQKPSSAGKAPAAAAAPTASTVPVAASLVAPAAKAPSTSVAVPAAQQAPTKPAAQRTAAPPSQQQPQQQQQHPQQQQPPAARGSLSTSTTVVRQPLGAEESVGFKGRAARQAQRQAAAAQQAEFAASLRGKDQVAVEGRVHDLNEYAELWQQLLAAGMASQSQAGSAAAESAAKPQQGARPKKSGGGGKNAGAAGSDGGGGRNKAAASSGGSKAGAATSSSTNGHAAAAAAGAHGGSAANGQAPSTRGGQQKKSHNNSSATQQQK